MEPSGSRKSFEQIEVIEHRIIEEGRRPSAPGVSTVPYSSVRNFTEKYATRGGEGVDQRFNWTGERDVSREPSFLHQSADYGQQIEVSPIRPSHLNTSGSSGHRVEFADTTNNTVINNYGYDVHEIHTSDGGARIVETHGGGPLHESSRLESTRIEESVERPGVSSALRSGAVDGMRGREERSSSTNQIFTVASGGGSDAWRRQHEDSESFVRKDSYKKMQISDDVMSSRDQSRRSFVPPSQTSLVSKSTLAEREGCWQRTKRFFVDFVDHLRTVTWTPSLMASMCCIVLLLLLLLILIGIILNALFHRYAVSEFLLFPPVCEECRRKNPQMASPQLPSSLFLHFYSSDQAHFELRGNPPFKSNSFTAVDFKTGYVAIADHALTDSTGRHFVCFLKPLDRSALSSIDSLMEASSDSSYEIQSTFGWQEFWQFEAEEIDSMSANSKFTDPIEDCKGAKWYLLRQAVHARDLSCSECYDFCLPDWAVVRKEKYEDESTIGVRRMDCFRLYVPEWSNFRVQTDVSGGHWQYPLSSQSTKRDQSGNWVSWVPTGNTVSRQRRTLN